MLVAERHQKILELLNEKKSIRVTELSQLFSVTEETIRRDLEKLERENKLCRSHGGAISIQSLESQEISYSKREITNVKEKQEIALEAVKYIEEGDKITLDASTTAWYMAKQLPDIRLTVVTNSIKVATELSAKKQITVISTGGILLPRSLSFVGPLAEEALEKYHVNKAFISCKGIHLENGISESDEQQSLVKRKMIENAEYVYVMADHTKFGQQSFIRTSNLNEIDIIITDSKLDDKNVQEFQNRGIQLIRM